jgi:phosphatidylinositol alpha-1,6-mannosyltransferase
MKICLITPEFYPFYGGIGRSFTDMCKAFKGKKDKLFIFNGSYRGKNIFDILDTTKSYKLRDLLVILKERKNFFYFLISIWKIFTAKRVKTHIKLNMLLYLFVKPKIVIKLVKNLSSVHPFLKKINPDIIYGAVCDNTVMPLGFVLSRLMGKKFICSAHGTDFLVRTRYSLKTNYLKAIDKIILSSAKTKELIKKINHLDDNKLIIIPYGLYLQDLEVKQNPQQIKNTLQLHPEDFIIISVGRHVPRKNFQLVIKAMKNLKDTKPQAQLKYFLIGSGPDTDKLKIMTKNLKLGKIVTFLGNISDSMRNKYLKASDLFVLPSIATKKAIEGFGLVYLEANFFNLPVIGTISGGITEAIEDHKSGILIKPNDLNDLIDAILYLYQNEEERARMGEYGHNKVINRHNWNLLANEYIRVFEDLIKE